MGWSILLDELILLAKQEKLEIQAIKDKYKKLECEVKGRCTHKYDDGTDATIRARYGYSDYRTHCEICGKRVK